MAVNRKTSIEGVKLCVEKLELQGRGEETSFLLEELDNVRNDSKTCSLILVTGLSGTGKTTLVAQLEPHVLQTKLIETNKDKGTTNESSKISDIQTTNKNSTSALLPSPGFYCRGKFGENERVSGRALRNALGKLCAALMEHPDLIEIRMELQEKLTTCSGVICAAVEGLNRVMGIGGRGNSLFRNSSSMAFKRGFEQLKWGVREFLRIVCKPTRPCVLLVDDLQAAGIQSIELLKFVAKANIPGLMLIGTYRKDEINVLHPLTTHLMHELSESITTIEIGNLKESDVNRLLSDLIDRHPEDTREFAEVLFQKCRGNCFWTIQFLQLLRDDQYLFYSNYSFQWEWDLEAIRHDTCVTDNVVSFMVTKLRRLPPETLECLEAGSCLGHKFDVKAIVSVVEGSSVDDVHERLRVAMKEGLVTRREGTTLYRFAHDRIMEASYLVLELDQERRDKMHWNIGSYLKSQLQSLGQIWRILVAAEQMNLASDKYCVTHRDKLDLVKLNLEAARVARMQHVFVTAAKFVDAALDLFRDDMDFVWSQHRDLALDLLDLGAHLQVTIGENDRAIEMVESILNANCKLSDLERSRALCIRLEILGGQMRHKKAMEQTGKIVCGLGLNFPRRPRKPHIAAELLKVKIALKKVSYSDLVDLPEIEDERTRIIMWCLSRGILYGYDAQDNDFTGMCVLKLASHCLTNGVCVEATLGFQMLGLYLGHIGGFDRCYELGKVAMELQERFTGRRDGLTSAYAYFFNNHIRHPLSESLEPLLSCYEGSMEYGDPTEAHICAYLYVCCYFDLGLSLRHILNDVKAFEKEAEFYGRDLSIKPINSIKSALCMLVGELDSIDEKGYLAQALKDKDLLLCQTFWAKELCAYVYLGDWENCRRVFDLFERERKVFTTKYCTGFLHFHFLRGVAAHYLYNRHRKIFYRLRARAYLKEFEGYVKNKLGNAQHMHAILQALDGWVHKRGTVEEIRVRWDSAVRLSLRGGYIHQTALANELAAECCTENNQKYWAKCYSEAAHERYTLWGASAKVDRMKGVMSGTRSTRANPRESNPVYRSGRFGRERYKNMMKLHALSAFNLQFMQSQRQESKRGESIFTELTPEFFSD